MHIDITTTLPSRFWAKVDKNGPIPRHRPELGPCWCWTASCNRGGYGMIGSGGHGPVVEAHRVSWTLHFGQIPEGAHVLHHCDNRVCVRPTHLFLGNNAINVADRTAKGRSNRFQGERHPMATLTNEQASVIAARYAAGGVTLWQLAREYGIRSHSTIRRIVNGTGWQNISRATQE